MSYTEGELPPADPAVIPGLEQEAEEETTRPPSPANKPRSPKLEVKSPESGK